MAVAIKTIPILTGEVAERFVAMADENMECAITRIPEDMRRSIQRMKERSRKFQIKRPR